MNTDQLIQLFIHADKVLGGKWQMFVTVNLAIFGWLIVKSQPYKLRQILPSLVAYSLFALMMYFSFENDHLYHNALITDLVSIIQNSPKAEIEENLHLKNYLSEIKNLSFLNEHSWGGPKYIWGGCWTAGYIVSAIGVGFFIASDILTVGLKDWFSAWTKNTEKSEGTMTDEIIKNLGPLAPLAGIWEGDKGNDTAPSQDLGTKDTPFRERFTFEPLGPVNNHQQALYGLRYNRTVWPEGASDPFHEDLGYWLWDAKPKQVMRCFIVPRGVTVIAGGTVEPDAKSFELAADAGSQTYGICSNQFLDKEFKTVRYELKIVIHDDQSFSYEEDTQLQIKGKKDLFHHIDKNTLKRTT